MRIELLQEADRLLAGLAPGRRESVREIVVDAVHRGELPPSGRAFIARVTGSTFLADVLSDAIGERARDRRSLDPAESNDAGQGEALPGPMG